MSRALVGLGSNLGDRTANLSAALAALGGNPGVIVQSISSFHPTKPVGGPPGQLPYLNAAAVLETSLAPEALLDEFQRVEAALGRRREAHWGPRTIDLDLLLFDDLVIEAPRLIVPHPWLAVRRFVLAPAVEVAADWTHPVVQWTLGRLLAHFDAAPNYLALCGPPGVGKTRVAEQLAANRGLRLLRDPDETPPPPSASIGPTSPGWDAQLEFMTHSRRLLGLASLRSEWAISDFWFGQSLAYAAIRLSPEAFTHYEERWHKAAAMIDSPKLIVLLDPPLESVRQRQSDPPMSRPQAADWFRLRDKLVELVLRPNWGPVLRLRQSESAEIVSQLGAAIDAMQ